MDNIRRNHNITITKETVKEIKQAESDMLGEVIIAAVHEYFDGIVSGSVGRPTYSQAQQEIYMYAANNQMTQEVEITLGVHAEVEELFNVPLDAAKKDTYLILDLEKFDKSTIRFFLRLK